MGYFITTQGRNELTLFLVDRSVTRKKWWTTKLYEAMKFRKYSSAEYSLKKLKYKNPSIVGENEAKRIENENLHINCEFDIHPFSSEALGQD
jgi:hypothetical protein